jgi:hypothetical protein
LAARMVARQEFPRVINEMLTVRSGFLRGKWRTGE